LIVDRSITDLVLVLRGIPAALEAAGWPLGVLDGGMIGTTPSGGLSLA
jgi:hypothetical protein